VIIIIVIAVLVLIVLGIGGYFGARRMRGTIKMTLDRRGVNAGEQLNGNFMLTTRKAIEGKRLFAALIGKEVTREQYRDSNNRQQTRTNSREIYRDEQTIEDARLFPAGMNQEYSFTLNAPAQGSQDAGFTESTLGQTLRLGMELMGGRRTHLEWQVSVRLDAKGIDLNDNEKVTVNLGLD
jgi:hypothetical protein